MTNDKDGEPPEPMTASSDVADERDPTGTDALFPVVGVGASAGGLEAFTQLLKALPAETGMAFVLVQHLAPSHPSALAEILSRATKMPVMEVHDEPTVEPNTVYVIPPDRSMIIIAGALQLLPREGGMLHRPIDQFFRSLAVEHRHQAIGVVLSGTASDGTLGLEAIKAEGGITFAQDSTAQQEGMPHSAIASGCVDFVLPPHEIANEIVRISRHPYAVPEVKARQTDEKPNLARVLKVLKQVTGVDFTGYKFNTLYRRVTRRMVFQKLDSLSAYVEYLRQTPAEVEALYQDILISVTSFFRDKESFEALKKLVFPRLLRDRSRYDPVRLWTLGCSTGQEAYSLAMAFTEAAEAAGNAVPLQLFASDLNAVGIEKARTGIYPSDIVQDVSPERLRRFFTEVDGGYRISKTIRDACVFSRHNVLADPPFSRIDLISCRNLLIYLEPVLQKRIMPTLHYALKPDGCLWLGGSETIGSYRNLFDAEDTRHKIYIKKAGSGTGHGHFPLQPGATPRIPFTPITVLPREGADMHREADRLLSAKFAPPGVLVSADLDILQYRGDTGPYLAPTPGKASLHLLKMLRQGLLVAVRAALLRAGKEDAPVREEGLRVKSGNGWHELAVEVIPIKGNGDRAGGFLVLFDDSSPASRAASAAVEDAEEAAAGKLAQRGSSSVPLPDPETARLAQELVATREYLQSVIEQQEAANEELQSANEEVQSANEELQSTNEELETSKEEIQSSNEELATVNDELHNRNAELNRINDDLANLFSSVQMAVVMVGPDLRVRRFTPTAGKLLNLIASDLGRPLADIKLNLENLADLEPLLLEVLATVSVREREVQDKQGCWYSLRLRPYRTLDNKIDGVVVMLVDVDAMKRAQDSVRESEARYRAIFEATSVGMSECNPATGRLLRVNDQFARIMGYEAQEVVGKTFLEITHPDDLPGHWEGYARLARGEVASYDVEKRLFRKDGSIAWVQDTVNLVRDAADQPLRTVAITVDITQRKRAEEFAREHEERYQTLFNSIDEGFCVIEKVEGKAGEPLDFRYIEANPAFAVQSGISDVVGKTIRQVVPNEPEDWLLTYDAVLRTGEPIRFERGFATQGRMLELYAFRVEHQTQRRIAIIFKDITRRSQMDTVLRESEEQFRLMANATPVLVWLSGTDKRFVWFNKTWLEFVGRSMEQEMGDGWTENIHPDDFAHRLQAYKAAFDARENFSMQYRLKRHDGQYRWVLDIGNPRYGAMHEFNGYIGSCTDIHEQRETADQLRQNATDLVEADRRKNEFLAMLAHELRNPLAPIRNAVQMLRLMKGGGTAIQSASAMMERQITQLVRLVDDLLDVSRSSLGKIELRKESVDLASVVKDAVEVARPVCESQALDLVVTLSPEPIRLNADPARLVQVVSNLLSNACKFSDKGGQVHLTVEREAEQAIIRVKDNGVGIAANQLSPIFDMFVQVDTSLERSISGLGIGLTLAKSLVEMHGGTLAVHSDGIGQGSEFVVRLPLDIEHTAEPAMPDLAPGVAPAVTALRVLVVDDNRDAATTLAELLSLTGHQTQTAFDGLEAVQAAATFRPDAVLLDIGLPRLNGYEVCRRIRAESWGKAMVIVALTGWGQEEDRKKSREAGFNQHMVKPVDFDVLMKLLAELLPAEKLKPTNCSG